MLYVPRSIRAVATLLAAVSAVVTIAAPAGAGAVQERIDRYLIDNPGGIQVSATDIAYGDLIVTVVRSAAAGVPDCPSGWFCFYDGANYTYPRGKLSDCGPQDLGTWNWRNRVASVDYQSSTGSVTFINETGATDTALFTASTSRRRIPDVAPNRDKADYVYRSC
ncbi:hypothetical protein Prum_020190 [Phytohabitans rumicis]|uniref:Peptidase inhibitor family I36 n=1 Tax=Phytohabitans rumicis TaxID=1076125 RepID=A0A6V8L2P0_9ACTN|nr:hypothetical protein Prum_020190 [Phytohabitans rumicis]